MGLGNLPETINRSICLVETPRNSARSEMSKHPVLSRVGELKINSAIFFHWPPFFGVPANPDFLTSRYSAWRSGHGKRRHHPPPLFNSRHATSGFPGRFGNFQSFSCPPSSSTGRFKLGVLSDQRLEQEVDFESHKSFLYNSLRNMIPV